MTTPDGRRIAFVYTRVSTQEQAAEGATSLDDQATRCRAYAAAQGWQVGGVFTDAGVSGGKALGDRPAGGEMLARLEAGEATAVIVLKVDRFTRSLSDSGTLEAWKRDGIAFVSVAESFDTSQPTGSLMLDLLQVFAKFERQRIAERNADGRRAITTDERYQDEHGRVTRWIGGWLPIGYTTDDDGTIVADEEQADNVRRVFALRAAGMSTTAIARKMADEGRTPRPRNGVVHPWSDSLAVKVLDPSTRVYLGGGIERRHSYDEAPVVFAAPALVDADTWAKAEAQGRQVAARTVEGAGERRYTYGLSGRIRHRHDDGTLHTMTGRTRPTVQGDTRWVRCSTYNTTGCDGFGEVQRQNMTAVRADWIEAAAWLTVASDWQAIEAARTDAAEAEAARLDVAAERATLTRLERRLRGFEEMRADGDLSRADFLARKAEIDAQAHEIEARLAKAERQDDRRRAAAVTLADLLGAEIVWTQDGAEIVAALAESDTSTQARAVLQAEPDRYGRIPSLPAEVVQEVAEVMAALDLVVVVEASDDPRRPAFEVVPAEALQSA